MQTFRSVKKLPLPVEIQKQLSNAINDGVYKPGDKLPSERELVDQFQVSRVTIREALTRLQNAGLIAIRRGMNAGTYVTEPSPVPITKTIENLISFQKLSFVHLVEARLYLEPESARAAAYLNTDADIARMKQLVDQAEEAANVSWKEARRTNIQFHCEIARIAQNPIILFIIESISQVYADYLIEVTKTKLEKEAILKHINEHRAILTAIEKGDGDGASDKTRHHLMETYRTYSSMITEVQDQSLEDRLSRVFQRGIRASLK
ncbi:MAG: FadR/GntR family transcriptional regulator [Desulfobacteraceae bacterium]|jgi:DNA-binding FadR family transcriptional regulator